MCATSMNGACGRTLVCRRARFSCRASCSHATNLVEHPDLVADRIVRYAKIVGRENVIAGSDCGLGNRVHPEIVWAKLASLAEGARRASKELWG